MTSTPVDEPGDAPAAESERGRFRVRLTNFEGPFDLLLQLIGKHKLDVTEVALSVVTDDFLAHLRTLGSDTDLDETTEFLVIAATLVDLKAARLLPSGEVEDEADLELLEARDLLFARLLQYRAYKQMAETFRHMMEQAPRRYPRSVTLEERLASLLPEVLITLPPEAFAQLAAKAMQPRPEPEVGVVHLHAPAVSVQEEAELVVSALRSRGEVTFRDLAADSPSLAHTVARFLALLELYRTSSVTFEQEDPLGALTIRWTGGDADEVAVSDEFDRPAASAPAGEEGGPA